MNGENLIESECGYYDEFHQLLAEEYIGLDDVEVWHEKKFITDEQYQFAKEYLKGD